eukprot:Sspe_Gene.38973::Locus_18803_Transcript_1_2_Confidence_0.400_Length_3854::g.38973::m.38973
MRATCVLMLRTSVGGVVAVRRVAKQPAAVPVPTNGPQGHHFLAKWEDVPLDMLPHLRWMLQKDLLGQDMFLVGPPGPLRRRLVLQYAALLQREVEYIAITKDTTDSDLKQRREITDGTMRFEDQPPVRAAVTGGMLVLEGIEKAERNVLPTLNNLLENREMALDDGRFLVHPTRFKSLLRTSSFETLVHREGLLCTHPDFRVVALGLPCPPYTGYPLDPPLRSRFQARYVDAPRHADAGDGPLDSISRSLEEVRVLISEKPSLAATAMPPAEVVADVRQLVATGIVSPGRALEKAYPFPLLECDEVNEKLTKHSVKAAHLKFRGVNEGEAKIEAADGTVRSFPVPHGTLKWVGRPLHLTPELETLACEMLIDLSLGKDICLVGPSGGGKSHLVEWLASQLGYDMELVQLYKDMSTRELLMRRGTDSKGNTVWTPSPLLHGALRGQLVVLDGVHRLSSETLATLHSLVLDREVSLNDGRRLLRSDRYDALTNPPETTLRIHPSFRIVALGNPDGSWLTAEATALFSFHSLPVLPLSTLTSLPPLPDELQLSVRQALRIHRQCEQQGTAAFPSLVRRACMVPFMAAPMREQFEAVLGEEPPAEECPHPVEEDGILCIGDVRLPVNPTPECPQLVPQAVPYYNNPAHSRYMKAIMADLARGERNLLLIGNQGTGKNKIVDRLLQLLGWEREYIQLHRDTTVQNLTVRPVLHQGVVEWEDSPLVKAVKYGRVLVVDEADKAAVEVVCVLKGLLEDQYMLLSDGRRISGRGGGEGVIPIHPNFKLIALANRPGFPFLGNDFFRECGDVFSCHIIENPDEESQLALLRQYSQVDDTTLRTLIASFKDLSTLVADGVISYPFSTRELVAIVKHATAYPQDGLVPALSNVFDFDASNKDLLETFNEVFEKHGVPIGKRGARFIVDLAEEREAEGPGEVAEPSEVGEPQPLHCTMHTMHRRKVSNYFSEIKGPVPSEGYAKGRLLRFSEELVRFEVPKGSTMCGWGSEDVVVLTKDNNLLTFSPPYDVYTACDLSPLFGRMACSVHPAHDGRLAITAPTGVVCFVARKEGDATLSQFPEEVTGVPPGRTLPWMQRHNNTTLFRSAGLTFWRKQKDGTPSIIVVRDSEAALEIHLPDPGEVTDVWEGDSASTLMVATARGEALHLLHTASAAHLTHRGAAPRDRAVRCGSLRVAIVRGGIEVLDEKNGTARVIHTHDAVGEVVNLAPVSQGVVAVLHEEGVVRLLEVDSQRTTEALEEWMGLFSDGDSGQIAVKELDVH